MPTKQPQVSVFSPSRFTIPSGSAQVALCGEGMVPLLPFRPQLSPVPELMKGIRGKGELSTKILPSNERLCTCLTVQTTIPAITRHPSDKFFRRTTPHSSHRTPKTQSQPISNTDGCRVQASRCFD